MRLIREGGGEAVFLHHRRHSTAAGGISDKDYLEVFGRLDFAFNNAGTEGVLSPLIDLPDDPWDETIDTNLKGVWLCLKYELGIMKERGGAIVNNSTNITQVGIPGTSIYSASKGGVDARKIATPEDIARAVVWLCSPDAGHITGQTITIDGGFTILR